MNNREQARRVLIKSLLAGSVAVGSVGCSSTGGFPIASINPFSKNDSLEVKDAAAGPTFGDSIASSADGARETMSSFGATAKTAVSKSTGAVKGIFASSRLNKKTGDEAESTSEADPLSLSNKPEKVDASVFVANGRLWESTGNSQKAMESYTKALETEPGNAEALANIARMHFRNEDHPQAADFFSRAIKSKPDDAGLYNDLGLTLSKMGNHGAAAETLKRALQLAPGTSRYANNLASVLYDGGNAESAYQVLKDNNEPAVAHFNMAYLHQKNGHIEDARKHLNETLRFEAQAVSDSSVKRAIDRSREMLAKLDGPSNSVAQAAPQATVASRPQTSALPAAAAVRQTSQSVPQATSPASIGVSYKTPGTKPAANASPMFPPSVQSSAPYGGLAKPAAPAIATKPATATQPAAKPAYVTPSATTPTPAPAASKPSGTGFSLPEGFNVGS